MYTLISPDVCSSERRQSAWPRGRFLCSRSRFLLTYIIVYIHGVSVMISAVSGSADVVQKLRRSFSQCRCLPLSLASSTGRGDYLLERITVLTFQKNMLVFIYAPSGLTTFKMVHPFTFGYLRLLSFPYSLYFYSIIHIYIYTYT